MNDVFEIENLRWQTFIKTNFTSEVWAYIFHQLLDKYEKLGIFLYYYFSWTRNKVNSYIYCFTE